MNYKVFLKSQGKKFQSPQLRMTGGAKRFKSSYSRNRHTKSHRRLNQSGQQKQKLNNLVEKITPHKSYFQYQAQFKQSEGPYRTQYKDFTPSKTDRPVDQHCQKQASWMKKQFKRKIKKIFPKLQKKFRVIKPTDDYFGCKSLTSNQINKLRRSDSVQSIQSVNVSQRSKGKHQNKRHQSDH